VDIFTSAEYAWYELVKVRDTGAKFPVSKIQLGKDLGAAIDIGPTMARKILKKNGSAMYRTYLRPLTPDEILNLQLKRRIVKSLRSPLKINVVHQ
jgi:hypothetical protein